MRVVGRRGKAADGAGVDASGGAKLQELFCGGVLTDCSGETDARSKGRDLARDVGGATEPMLAAQHPHHGHRGLGRDPLDGAGDVLIEHHIAHDPHVQVREAFEVRKQRADAAAAVILAHGAACWRISRSNESMMA